VDRAADVSANGGGAADVRPAGDGYWKGTSRRGADLSSAVGTLWGACSILVVANVVNIGADLGGMAEATQLISGIPTLVWIPVYAFLIIGLLIWISYKKIAKIFKWLTLVLFAYVLASFFAHVDWRHALAVTFVPHLEWSSGFLAVLVAILGTTISPYLFFWQAAEEVEEERAKGRTPGN